MAILKNRTVLVTGADGFIGSHLTERLVELGANVRAFCFYNSNGSLGWLDEASDRIKSCLDIRLGDIRDARFVEESCRGMDTVFHLAALIAIPYSYQAPESFIDTNIKGTLNVLEGARRAKCRRIIHTSTSEVYGTPASLPIRENHPLQGQSPYSATKIAADKLCEAFHRSFGVPITILRPFNTYGPRQSMRAVLPTILVQLLAGKKNISLGNLAPRRDLAFVSDTVEGYICCAETERLEGRVIQLGTGQTYSIHEVFEMACRVLGMKARVRSRSERVRSDASEVMVLQSDPALAHDTMGWMASISLEKGIKLTADWLKPRLNHYAPERYHV